MAWDSGLGKMAPPRPIKILDPRWADFWPKNNLAINYNDRDPLPYFWWQQDLNWLSVALITNEEDLYVD